MLRKFLQYKAPRSINYYFSLAGILVHRKVSRAAFHWYPFIILGGEKGTGRLSFLEKLYSINCNFTNYSGWGAKVVQWWERSPPSNVARVRIPASAPYVGWVCCWFSPLIREVFLRAGFLLSLKTNTSKFQFDLERTDTFQRVHMNSWVFRG